MKKWVKITGAVFAVVVILFAVALWNLGPIIKLAVNMYGQDITRTDVHLSKVDVSLLSAKAEIKKLFIGNPVRFKSTKAISIKSIFIDMDEKSLLEDPIIIDRIEIVAPVIIYEKTKRTDNFQAILNNIKNRFGPEKVPEKKSTNEPERISEGKARGKKIIIKELIVRDGKIKTAAPVLGGKVITTKLPDIHLRNIGREGGGRSPGQALNDIGAILYTKIIASVIRNTLDSQIRRIGSTLDETEKAVEGRASTTGKEAEQSIKGWGKMIKGLLGE